MKLRERQITYQIPVARPVGFGLLVGPALSREYTESLALRGVSNTLGK
jgi:hypothetical protein